MGWRWESTKSEIRSVAVMGSDNGAARGIYGFYRGSRE